MIRRLLFIFIGLIVCFSQAVAWAQTKHVTLKPTHPATSKTLKKQPAKIKVVQSRHSAKNIKSVTKITAKATPSHVKKKVMMVHTTKSTKLARITKKSKIVRLTKASKMVAVRKIAKNTTKKIVTKKNAKKNVRLAMAKKGVKNKRIKISLLKPTRKVKPATKSPRLASANIKKPIISPVSEPTPTPAPVQLSYDANHHIILPAPSSLRQRSIRTFNRSMQFAQTAEHNVVAVVQKTMHNLRYSTYKLGGHDFDPAKGVYVVDCSDYVDHLIYQASPSAYSSVTHWSRTDRPTTSDYFDFFKNLSPTPVNYWSKVDKVDQLRPGDVLVFRYGKRSRHVGGHIMVVMSKPAAYNGVFAVRVTDSAAAGHSQDTRAPHKSGVGIGTLLLKVNPRTKAPNAYAWRAGNRWQVNTDFAMGRPLTAS